MKRIVEKLNILRFLAVLLICSTLVSFTALSVSAVESGACGEGIGWVLEAGTLTITGAGEMKNYRDSELAPWYEFREQIIRVNISDKVTSIGNFAFYGCKNLVSVYIPNSVKTIGSYAFASCNRLTSVQMSGSATYIGDGAFYSCYALESIRLPYGLTHLGSQAFYRCESLKSVYVPSDVRSMGDSVFAYCKSLVRAEIYARIGELPAWTFYGCSQLTEVYLPETVKDIENNGFKKCDSLTTVFYPGTEKQAEKLEEKISGEVASFETTGHITNAAMPETSMSGSYIEKEYNLAVNTNTVVLQNSQIVLSYTVEQTYDPQSTKKGTHTINIVLTIESEKHWSIATEEILNALNVISNMYSEVSTLVGTNVKVYLENDVKFSKAFLSSLAGKEIELVVVLANGSGWSINCKDVKVSDLDNEYTSNYSHSLKEAPAEVAEKLGTDDCFRLVFDESVEQKAEVIVQLPPQTAVHTNAYLYQIEDDGTYTKLQAVAVDNNGCTHFYIGSADPYSDYIIGLDVAGEDGSDVIIPDELMPPVNNSASATGPLSPLDRLEDIQYVEVERNYHMGFGYGGLTWILIAVLVGTTIIVGGIMIVINRSKKIKAEYKAKLEEINK